MANTYTQLYVQFIFATKFRLAMIDISWKETLHKYITGIFQNNKHKMLQINSMPDHMHILIGLSTDQAIASIMQNVKSESSKWINEKKLTRSKFGWQEGYGAFTYSKSQLPQVIKYIQKQELHHKKRSFLDEYRSFLHAFGIEFDERYIFKEPI